MKVLDTSLPEVKILEPQVHGDARGFFLESWNARTFANLGLDLEFVQDNHSHSGHGTLRGIHYQLIHPQGKLVRVTRGIVYDVAVDLRRSSRNYGHWVGVELSDQNHRMLWVPPGFGHGFYVVSHKADFIYKCTEFYYPQHDRAVRWDDPELAIDWPLPAGEPPALSAKDAEAPLFKDAETYE